MEWGGGRGEEDGASFVEKEGKWTGARCSLDENASQLCGRCKRFAAGWAPERPLYDLSGAM